MSIIGLAGIFQGVGAINSFQIMPGVSPLVWLAVASVFSAIIAGWWWLEYGAQKNKTFWLWTGFWAILNLELIWAVELLPLGYLVSSLILIWCWYVLWLMVRFNLSKEGIDWRKQIWFLGINSVLFILFLFFIVRWK